MLPSSLSLTGMLFLPRVGGGPINHQSPTRTGLSIRFIAYLEVSMLSKAPAFRPINAPPTPRMIPFFKKLRRVVFESSLSIAFSFYWFPRPSRRINQQRPKFAGLLSCPRGQNALAQGLGLLPTMSGYARISALSPARSQLPTAKPGLRKYGQSNPRPDQSQNAGRPGAPISFGERTI